MLTSAALVLMMTGPGLALFYGGLVRRKNVLATMMQSFAMMCIVTVLWAIIGYSLAFGPGTSFIGDFHYVFLHNVGLAPDPDYAATIPAQTYMIYQLMFAIITPALICGAFAERMKFSAMCLFLTLWSLIVYSPMAHMVWGKGGLLNAALGGKIPCLDFAGGTVVHITSGVSALVCALYLGKRVGYPKEPSPPHSVVLSFIGACLLWVGWFGFNAGSALAANGLATSAFVNTHFASRYSRHRLEPRRVDPQRQAQRAGRHLRSRRRPGRHHPRLRIRPAHVRPRSSASSPESSASSWSPIVKSWFGYDDSLDAFGVHGAGGTIGALLTGFFASSAINPIFGKDKPTGADRWQLASDPQSAGRNRHRLDALDCRHPNPAQARRPPHRPPRHPRRRDRGPRRHPARRRRLRLRFLIS